MSQLDSDQYLRLTPEITYGQSDGLYWDKTNSLLVLIINGAVVFSIDSSGTILAGAIEAPDLSISGQTRGDLLYRAASSWARLAVGAGGAMLKSDGTDPAWLTVGTTGQILNTNGTAPSWASISGDATMVSGGALTVTDVTVGSDATGDLLYKSSATALARLAIGGKGKVLTVSTSTLPSWASVDASAKYTTEDYNAYATTTQLSLYQSDTTAFDGSTGVHNILSGVNQTLNVFPLGAGQTLSPAIVAAGLDVGGDQTDNEGYELTSHWNIASGRRPFVIGQDAAFYFLCKFQITTIEGCDVLAVGFRRAFGSGGELIVRADLNDYLDFAALGLTTAATPGAIKIQTADDNAATTVTDTTDTIASATALQVKVLVSAAGVVTYQHDAVTPGTLAAPTTTAAFTFDDGDPVVPWFHFLNANAAQAGGVIIHKWEAGYQ